MNAKTEKRTEELGRITLDTDALGNNLSVNASRRQAGTGERVVYLKFSHASKFIIAKPTPIYSEDSECIGMEFISIPIVQ